MEIIRITIQGCHKRRRAQRKGKKDGSSHLIPVERIIKFARGNFD